MSRTCRCVCGDTITLPGPMDTWQARMDAHVQGRPHREWLERQERKRAA